MDDMVSPGQDGLSVLGAGIVTRAPLSGRRVLIKTLADHLAGDPVLRARFLRAAELGMRLSHPNVVRVFEAGIEGRPFVVMDHIDGESLAERTQRNGRLPAAETLMLATHLAAGLAHAHASGVVHGALAPHSIMVGHDGVARISDFGFARLLRGEGRPSPADDVYDLALLLREVGADPLPPGLTTLIDATTLASEGPSVERPSVFDFFHHVVTIIGPPEVWLPPAGVRVTDESVMPSLSSAGA